MGKDKVKIVFHVFSNHQIGGGHLSRCLALAKHMLKNSKFEIYFVTNKPDFVIFEGISSLTIEYEKGESEVNKVLKSINPDVIIYDLLDISSDYVANTKISKSLTVVFDYYDRESRLTSANIVFNFHESKSISDYIEAQFYEGIEYGILAEEFYDKH